MEQNGIKSIDSTNEIRVIQELVRRQVSRILPMAFKEEDGQFIVFEGESDRIMYVSPMPGYLGKGGPHVQLIEIVNAKGGKILQFSHWLMNDSLEEESFNDSEQEPIVLLENVKDAEFSFIRLDEFGEITDWEYEWEEPENTPLMVRLEVDMGDEALMQWPIMEVALMMDPTATNRRVSDHLMLRGREQQDGARAESKGDIR